MAVGFNVMEQHIEGPRVPVPDGRLVLSRLAPGSSMIGARSPSVKMVLDGEEIYEIDGHVQRVRPGEFLYLEAGANCVGINKVDTLGLCLMLPITEGGGAPQDPLLGRAVTLSTRTSSLGHRLFEYGRQIARDPDIGSRIAPAILCEVTASLEAPLAESRAALRQLKAVKASTRRLLLQRLERARAFLHDHDNRNVTLAELGNVAGLSQFHLARYFRQAFGQAPIAYHRALRLERAAEFLARGEGNVVEAAELAGYSDQSALSHAFRKRFGCAPLQYAMRRSAA